MVNGRQMLKYTPAKIKKIKIKTVKSTRLIRAIYDSDEYGYHQKAMFKVVATTIPRRVNVKIYGDANKYPKIFQRPMWVHCSCEWFTFFCEYALAKRRSSEIVNSNGQPNKVQNPRQWPYVCKHVVAVFNRLEKVKFKRPKVAAPSEEELEFMMKEVEKYIPGRGLK